MRFSIIFIALYTLISGSPLLAYESEDGDSLVELRQEAENGNVKAQSSLAAAYWYNAQPASPFFIPASSAQKNTNDLSDTRQSNVCEKCAFWAYKAASHGDLVSIYMFGWAQFQSVATNRNESLGRAYLYYAAIHGYTLAQEQYAKLVFADAGGEKALVESAAFFTLAKESSIGLSDAGEKQFVTLQRSLSESQKAALSQRVSKLRAIIRVEKKAQQTQTTNR